MDPSHISAGICTLTSSCRTVLGTMFTKVPSFKGDKPSALNILITAGMTKVPVFAHLYECLFIWLLFRFLCHNPQEESRHKNPLPIGRCWAQIGYFSAAAGCHLPWKRNLEWRQPCEIRHTQGRTVALPSGLQTLHKSLFLTGSWICTVPCIQGGCGSTGKVRASITAFQAELLQQNPFALPAATDCTRRTPNFC